MQTINHPHDGFFKAIFSRPALAGDLLRQVLPPTLLARLDLATLHLQKDSFIDEDLQQQFADLLYSVTLVDQRPAWVYVLFEHKSSPQPLMAFDVLRYLVRIWEAGRKEQPPAPLTPILPIVVYHGSAPWREPLDMGAYFPGPADLRPHWPTFTYQLVDLNQWPAGAAAGMLHLQAALWALRYIYRHDLLDHLAELAGVLAELTKVYGDVEYAITVLHYVVTVRKEVDAGAIRQALRAASVGAEEELMATWLDERYEAGKQVGEEIGKEIGKQEGKQEGRIEEARRIALNFLQHRFGPLDASFTARVNRLEVEQLEALTTALFEAKELADIMPLLEE